MVTPVRRLPTSALPETRLVTLETAGFAATLPSASRHIPGSGGVQTKRRRTVGQEAYRSTASAAPTAPSSPTAPTATAAAAAERLSVRHGRGAPAPTAAYAPSSKDTAAAAAACADDEPTGQLLLHTPLLELDRHWLPVKPHTVVPLDRSQRVSLTISHHPHTSIPDSALRALEER
jgi:hypothetical protein